jgi:hypothetical protein
MDCGERKIRFRRKIKPLKISDSGREIIHLARGSVGPFDLGASQQRKIWAKIKQWGSRGSEVNKYRIGWGATRLK